MNGSEARRRVRRRAGARIFAGLHAAVAVALAAALLLLVNFLSFRHYRRTDIGSAGLYRLSEKSVNLLDGLTNDVEVAVLFSASDPLYDDIVNLLQEYRYRSPRVRVERVDPHRDMARAEELATRHGVREARVVVFAAAGRTRVVTAGDLVRAAYAEGDTAFRPSRALFRGEVEFSSAIRAVAHERAPAVYFLQGHGERDPADFDEITGYSGIAQALRRDHLDVRTLVLGRERGVPADCAALVIAGPDRKLAQPEIDLLAAFLDRSGRALILLDAAGASGLGPLLEDWNVRVGEDVVVDATRTLSGRELVVVEYGPHPVTAALRGVVSIFYRPCSVEPAVPAPPGSPPADQPRVTVLAASSEAGWAESDPEENPMQFDPLADRPGPVGVAVAVERGAGPELRVQIRPTRLVVVGDSDFASNGALTGGNQEFFLNSLNWLLDREPEMAIAAKPFEDYRLVMSRRQLWGLLWAAVVGLPGAVGVLGTLVWMRRRA